MKKLLGAEPQLGVVLFLVSVPIVGALALILMEVGVVWTQIFMEPLSHPLPALFALFYAGWGLTGLWKIIRRVPRTDEGGYIERNH